MAALLVIGGAPMKMKGRKMIGGGGDYSDEEGEADEGMEGEDGGGMDIEAKKDESVRLLAKAVGASPGATGRIKKALEAFMMAMYDEYKEMEK